MTYSVPGLGWPEDVTKPGEPADDLVSADAETDAWLRHLAGGADVPGTGPREHAPPTVVTGSLPHRYARRAARIGLGWPSGETADAGPTGGGPGEPELSSARGPRGPEGAGRSRPAASRRVGAGASKDNPDRADVQGGLGSSSAPQSSEPTPARVRQALAGVSRETGRLAPDPAVQQAAAPQTAVPQIQQCRIQQCRIQQCRIQQCRIQQCRIQRYRIQRCPNQQTAGRRVRVRIRWPFLLFPTLRPIRR